MFFIAKSASTYRWVVEVLSCPSHSAITLKATPDCSICIAVEWRLCSRLDRRHSAAMALLHSGVDCAVIASWLGHESMETTEIYLHASLELKQQAVDKTTPTNGSLGRYRPDDALLAFLKSL